MHVAAGCIGTLLIIWLVGVAPFVGPRMLKRVERHAPTPSVAIRRQWLFGNAVYLWMSVAIVVLIGVLSNRHAASIDLTVHSLKPQAVVISSGFIGAAVLLLLISIPYSARSLRRDAEIRRFIRRSVGPLPKGKTARLRFAVTAISAGICEEIVFRGFGIAFIRSIRPDASDALIVVITAIAFGIAHAHKGKEQVTSSTAFGGVCAAVTLATGTLIPAIFVHSLVDLRFLFLDPTLTDEEAPQAKPLGRRIRRVTSPAGSVSYGHGEASGTASRSSPSGQTLWITTRSAKGGWKIRDNHESAFSEVTDDSSPDEGTEAQ
jgi:membrane protease YdiL (CAAX protease family)